MIPLPAYIDKEAWDGFCEMRKASGRTRPFTTRAATLILFELQRLKDSGQDPNACLDQSTRHGWADVYPLKDKGMKQAPAENAPEREAWRKWESRTPEEIEASKRAKEMALSSLKLGRRA